MLSLSGRTLYGVHMYGGSLLLYITEAGNGHASPVWTFLHHPAKDYHHVVNIDATFVFMEGFLVLASGALHQSLLYIDGCGQGRGILSCEPTFPT